MASFRELSRTEFNWGAEAWNALCKVRETFPVIQCITSFVSMDIMSNSLLAAGASPAMVHGVEEILEFTARSSALCIISGTLSPDWILSMHTAALRANQCHKPWVLDPVGAGATAFRTEKCIELANLKPTVIRGCAPEIMAIVSARTLPARNAYSATDTLEAAKELARAAQTIVAMSGPEDLVTDGRLVLRVSNGVPFMQRITASGSAVSGLIAAFISVNPTRVVESTAIALALFGLAGELGMETANGPASLRVNLIDRLHMLNEQQVVSRVRIAPL